MAAYLNTPEAKAQVKKMFSQDDLTLFVSRVPSSVSRAPGGEDIVTLPGLRDELHIDDNTIPGKIIAGYPVAGAIPSFKEVSAYHWRATRLRKAIAMDTALLSDLTLQLPSMANVIYEQAEHAMRNFGLNIEI
jgi:hypothetical protein